MNYNSDSDRDNYNLFSENIVSANSSFVNSDYLSCNGNIYIMENEYDSGDSIIGISNISSNKKSYENEFQKIFLTDQQIYKKLTITTINSSTTINHSPSTITKLDHSVSHSLNGNNEVKLLEKKKHRSEKLELDSLEPKRKSTERYDTPLKNVKSKSNNEQFSKPLKKLEKDISSDKNLDPYIKEILNVVRSIFVVDSKKETNRNYFDKSMKEIIFDIFTKKYQASKEKTVEERLKKYGPPKKSKKNAKIISCDELSNKRSFKVTKAHKLSIREELNKKVNAIDDIDQFFKDENSIKLLDKTFRAILNDFINSPSYDSYYNELKGLHPPLYMYHYDLIVNDIDAYLESKQRTKDLKKEFMKKESTEKELMQINKEDGSYLFFD